MGNEMGTKEAAALCIPNTEVLNPCVKMDYVSFHYLAFCVARAHESALWPLSDIFQGSECRSCLSVSNALHRVGSTLTQPPLSAQTKTQRPEPTLHSLWAPFPIGTESECWITQAPIIQIPLGMWCYCDAGGHSSVNVCFVCFALNGVFFPHTEKKVKYATWSQKRQNGWCRD